MKRYTNEPALCFDDILLVPKSSDIKSRHDVDLTMVIGSQNQIKLAVPIIAAPMDTVCDVDMCVAMSDAGGMGILHRYMTRTDMIHKAKFLVSGQHEFGIALGATKSYLEDAAVLHDVGVRVFLIDIANGHSLYAIDAVKALRAEFGNSIHIMAGNVATVEGFARLAQAGADSVRVGIGGGSACTTRIVSGHGVPTLASLMSIKTWKTQQNAECSIIADGGIRTSGDMVKAFAAGADAVMVGSMLAGTDEAPGDVLADATGKPVKLFRGMASAQAQKDAIGKVSVAEGVSTTIPYKGPVRDILDHVKGGLGSGCSYSGVHSLVNLASYAEYIEVSSTSLDESRPHVLNQP